MKAEIVFALENAAWPALLVNAMGQVLMSNAAARTFFGAGLEAEAPSLAPFWSPKNETQFAGYLAWWEHSKPSPVELTFRSAGCVDKRFSVPIALLANEDGKWFLLQLLPLPELTPKPLEMSTEFRNATGDAALKQKLDCVLQLARTVSLDFNNALTGVLAHTSLLLGKAEPNHPWRSSLLEVEKSAARAAEIATELALFSRQEKEAPRTPAGNLNAVTSRCVEAADPGTLLV
jgi:signal transduction histidine kinase